MTNKDPKHTKGPWRIDVEDGVLEILAGPFKADDLMALSICMVAPQDDDEEMEANARLIAAAPNLLEACKNAYEHFCWISTDNYYREETNEILESLQKAIATVNGTGGNL